MGQYERINDLVYVLSAEIKLIFSVSLVSRDKNNRRYPYHSEYEYYKYGEPAISIKREASPMLCFKPTTGNGLYDVCITQQHFDRFYQSLASCTKWFDGTAQVFFTRGNRLYVSKEVAEKSAVAITELVNDKWITIEPIVILTENDMYTPGVRMCFNNQVVTDVPVDRFYGLVHCLTGFNMYMAMSMLLTYVNTCTPGTNLSTIGERAQQEGDVKGVNGRTVPKKSFFDNN